MKFRTLSLAAALLVSQAFLASAACAQSGNAPQSEEPSFYELRQLHSADVVEERRDDRPARKPDRSVMQLVEYPSEIGNISGYLTNPPGDGERYPAIIWISGGNLAIGDFWSPASRSNDQTASAFREAGIVTFYPSLRGLNGNPGHVEGYFGELDDLVAATQWLKQQPFIDPDRVYLGGHSTAGTLVLLAAEYSQSWRAVFAFGPVTDPIYYGTSYGPPIGRDDVIGRELRAPIHWLRYISVPTFILEGSEDGNTADLMEFASVSSNPLIQIHELKGCNHFSGLRPASEILAEAIVAGNVESMVAEEALAAVCD